MGSLTVPAGNAVLAAPQVDVQMAAPRNPSGESFLRRWTRRLIVFACIVVLIPVLLTILYLPSFVHPVSTLMIADLVTFKGYDRRWVAYDDIAPVMKRSVVMSEDGQFCSHSGVDLGELKGVVKDALDGEATRGASTIPMQTVKNLYLTNSRSFIRKGAEIPLAFYFDMVMPKKRILEIYLNIAEWGPGIYGIEAAAQHHFGVSAKDLTARQASLLTVALPNPILRNPGKPSRLLTRMARRIEQRAAQSGIYTACL